MDFAKLAKGEDGLYALTDNLLLPEAVTVEGDSELREIPVTVTLNDKDYNPKKTEE